MYHEFLVPQRPTGSFDEKDYLFNVGWSGTSTIRELLYQMLHLKVSASVLENSIITQQVSAI